MIDITVQIPEGLTCKEGHKCVFCRYNPRKSRYSCALFNTYLSGMEEPKKCGQCIHKYVLQRGKDNG